jgi:hypothetical protein
MTKTEWINSLVIIALAVVVLAGQLLFERVLERCESDR